MTKATKASDIKRDWHLIDLKDKTLGREASKIALLLMGKSKPYFVRNLDCGDYVVVINAGLVEFSGRKEEKKSYRRHSMYPGGFKNPTVKEVRAKKPEELIRHGVAGMLPQNKLKDTMLARLFVFAGAEHKYEDKFK